MSNNEAVMSGMTTKEIVSKLGPPCQETTEKLKVLLMELIRTPQFRGFLMCAQDVADNPGDLALIILAALQTGYEIGLEQCQTPQKH